MKEWSQQLIEAMAELLEFHSPEICGVVCRRNSEAEAPTIYFHASITHTANLEKCTVRATPAAFAHPERKQYLKKSTKGQKWKEDV